jgi:hypothetical protein
LKETKTKLFVFILTIALVLSITVLSLSARAQTTSVQTIILSNEYPGNTFIALANAGYYNYTIYQLVQKIATESNPSLANALTSSFLQDLQNAPASSNVFTKQLRNYEDYNAIAISADGNVQTVTYEGSTYYNTQGTSSLDAQVSGFGLFRVVYSSTQTPLTTFTPNLTYDVFAILYKPTVETLTPTTTPNTTPTPTVPEFPALTILPLALTLLLAAAMINKVAQKKAKLPCNL